MKVKCPECGSKVATENNPYKPFCSERCKDKDLAAWAEGKYYIEGDELISEDSPELEEGQNQARTYH